MKSAILDIFEHVQILLPLWSSAQWFWSHWVPKALQCRVHLETRPHSPIRAHHLRGEAKDVSVVGVVRRPIEFRRSIIVGIRDFSMGADVALAMLVKSDLTDEFASSPQLVPLAAVIDHRFLKAR